MIQKKAKNSEAILWLVLFACIYTPTDAANGAKHKIICDCRHANGCLRRRVVKQPSELRLKSRTHRLSAI